MPEPVALTRARAESSKALLAVEEAARVRMRETVARTVMSAAPGASPHVTIIRAAHAMENALATDIARIKTVARTRSRGTFAEELHAATGQRLLAPEEQRVRDTLDATQSAKAISAQWLALAAALIEERDASQAMRDAAEANDRRIDTAAITETSTTFNDERERVGAAHAERAKRNLLPVPLKMWWSELDRRRCPACKRLHMTIRPLGTPFPKKSVPGKVHPRCRCYESIAAFGVTYEE